ncbi:MAG: ATP-grasp domain-containing protein [Pirellulales bacterium]
MKIGWLVEAEMFDLYRDELMVAIRELGHEAKLIRPPPPPYRWEDSGRPYRETFPQESCVVTVGDIGLVTRIRDERLWSPGAFADVANYFCSSYYCHLGEYLLNDKYVMLPFGELRRCRDFLFETVGIDGQVFVRPDSPLKLFAGQVVSASTFQKDLDYLAFYEFPLNSLVVVSPPRSLDVEWRFVVADKQIVAGSQYRADGKFEPRAEIDGDAKIFAEQVASRVFEPERVWILDVCRTSQGEYRLLEIGGFSFSDLYLTNKRDVVEAVSRVALSIWKSAQG